MHRRVCSGRVGSLPFTKDVLEGTLKSGVVALQWLMQRIIKFRASLNLVRLGKK